jgi:hypothetical protein
VQANILYENPKAFYVICGSHILNLFLADAMKSVGTVVNFLTFLWTLSK